MTPTIVFIVIASYFGILIFISYLTSRNSDTETFFTGNKQSPWYLVAFGMIGASLSGVTFISVPGEVGSSAFSYFQMVIGYLLGYFVIATVLLPLYYRLNLVSIYSYLESRFGFWSYKTGAFYFLLSRTIGASFRLFLVAGVLQIAFFDSFGIPFWLTVLFTISLIWLYTFRAGIKTIVWTDTLQTFFMLSSVIISVWIIAQHLDMNLSEIIASIQNSPNSTIFDWDWRSGTNFFKQFFAGAFIAIVMTGLDQDMMQKNLTCRNIGDAQKNMFWFSLALLPVNLLFLSLGALLYVYAETNGIEIPKNTDDLYSMLALQHFGIVAGIVFLIGIVAAAFSSADSALTSLTTSFSIDFLKLDISSQNANIRKTKRWVHLGFSFLLFLVLILFKYLIDSSVVSAVFKVAGYTYGPLLGLYAFGLFTKIKVKDGFVPAIALLSPIITYFIQYNSEAWFNGYIFGFELLIVNGLITFIGLWFFKQKKHN